MDVVELEPVTSLLVRGLLVEAGQADGEDGGNGSQSKEYVFEEFETWRLIVGAAKAEVSYGDFEFEVGFVDGSASSSRKVSRDGDTPCGTKMAERCDAVLFSGSATAIAIATFESGAEDGR